MTDQQTNEALLIAGGIIGGISICMGITLAVLLYLFQKWPEKKADYLPTQHSRK